MNRRNHRPFLPIFALSAVAAFGVAGCTSKTAGTAEPAASSAPSAADQSGAGGGSAPKVPSPLNTASILSDACATLSSAKRSELGFGDGRPRSSANGPSCTFTDAADAGNQIDVTPVTANKNGLSDVYDTKSNDAYFEETQIGGYPAVFAAALDDRKNGKCGLFVGVTDQLSVNILAQYDNGAGASDPCPVVQKFGEAMVQTLKEG